MDTFQIITEETGEIVEYVKFSHEEEYDFAKWVMDVLTLPWIQTVPEFCDLVWLIYERRSKGKDTTTETANRLCDFIDHYDDRLPLFPTLKSDGKIINAPAKLTDSTEKKTYVQREVSRAWKETWEQHSEFQKLEPIFHSYDGTPHLVEGYEATQERRERAFWAEVDAVEATTGWARPQVVCEVSDYMVRGVEGYRWDDPKLVNCP